jgi:hypothetical protein
MSVCWTGPDKSSLGAPFKVEVDVLFGKNQSFECGGYMFHDFGFVRFYDTQGKDICFIRSDSILRLCVTQKQP